MIRNNLDLAAAFALLLTIAGAMTQDLSKMELSSNDAGSSYAAAFMALDIDPSNNDKPTALAMR